MEKAGCGICFTRHYCKPQPQRPLEEKRADFRALEGEAEGLLVQNVVERAWGSEPPVAEEVIWPIGSGMDDDERRQYKREITGYEQRYRRRQSKSRSNLWHGKRLCLEF